METAMMNGSDLKRAVLEIAQRYLDISSENDTTDPHRAAQLHLLMDRLDTGVFRIVVMGEVKKGKSRFINALLERPDVLPVDTDVATSTVYKVFYGPVEKYQVFFSSDDGDPRHAPDFREISHNELKQYGTETGNPRNIEQVDFIAIQLPDPILKEGIVVVDTPGVGGLFKKHRDITFKFAPHADVVIFVLDSVEAVISKDEVLFLAELKKTANQIIFVQTKTDQADAEQVVAWHRRNLSVISSVLNVSEQQVPYFLVSSKLKQLADESRNGRDLDESGFLAVIQYLQKVLIPRRDEILACRAASELLAEINAEIRQVADRRRIASETNRQKLTDFSKEVSDAQRRFQDWEKNNLPRRKRDLQDELGRLLRGAKIRAQDSFSPDSSAFKNVTADLQLKCQTAAQVHEMSEEVLNAYASHCTELAQEIFHGLQAELSCAFERTAQLTASDIGVVVESSLTIEKTSARELDNSMLGAFRSGFLNFSSIRGLSGMASYGAHFATGAAIALGIISNPVGWVIGISAGVAAIAASVWAGIRGFNAERTKQLQAQLNTLVQALRDTNARAFQGTCRIIDDTNEDLRRKVHDAFDAQSVRVRSELDLRLRETSESQSRTDVENRTVVEELTKREKSLSDMAIVLSRISKLGQASMENK